MNLSLDYWGFNIEIYRFHNIQSEIQTRILNKSEDFLGFQDKILRQNILNIHDSNVNDVRPYQ